MEEEKHVSIKHLEKLLFQEFQKLHEKFDRIEKNILQILMYFGVTFKIKRLVERKENKRARRNLKVK